MAPGWSPGPALPQRPAEQANVLGFRHAVAVARRRLEAGAVEDGQPAARGRDQAAALGALQGLAARGPGPAHHRRQELVRGRQVVAVDAVVAHHEPARETLLD